ncbi:MAG: DUF2085 domain-containing protein [Verrucomicrobiota bacterium]
MDALKAEFWLLLDWAGWMCHQLPERSPHCGAEVFPVCWRCAGLHLGLFCSWIHLLAARRLRSRFPSVRLAWFLSALMLPLMVDGLGNALRVWDSPGWWRALLGLGTGLGLPFLLAPLTQPLEPAEPTDRMPSLSRATDLTWPALAGLAAIACLGNSNSLSLFSLLALAAALGWSLFLAGFVLGA